MANKGKIRLLMGTIVRSTPERAPGSTMQIKPEGKVHVVGDEHCPACIDGFPEPCNDEMQQEEDYGGLIHAEVTAADSLNETLECDKCGAHGSGIELEALIERPLPRFEDRGSVFAGKNVSYAIEKILDYCFHPNVEGTQHFADFGVKQLIAGLQELETKMRQARINVDNSNFPTALRTVSELQQYIDKQPSSITDEIEARIYVQSLERDLEELRRWERDLDEEPPQQKSAS